jgi:hypothetical protein
MTWHAATTSVLATAIDLEEEAQLAAAQDSSAGESETEPAVWDALPLFTFGSCWLNKVVDKELLLTFHTEDTATKMAAVHCWQFIVSL